MHKTATSLIKLGLATVATALVVSGCSLPKIPKLKIPRVHKISIQQGNVITQDMIDRLKPGMTRTQVAYVMGEPVLRNTFDDSRWDYIYTLDVPTVINQQVRMTLHFEDDQLIYFTGDLVPSAVLNQAADSNPGEPLAEEENREEEFSNKEFRQETDPNPRR